MAKGKGGLACVVRTACTILVPLVCVCGGFPCGTLVCLLSLLSAGFEVWLWWTRSLGQSGKRRHSIRPAGFFPLQLVGLYMLQVWLVMFVVVASGDGATAAGAAPVAPHAPGPLLVGSAGNAGLAAAAGLRGAAEAAARAAPAAVPQRSGPRPYAPPAGPEFKLDEDPDNLRWSPKTISVVLPCAEERDYALKTVISVFESTPGDVLHEIVVVDDGSNPPLSSTHLTPDVQQRYKVLVKRHDQTIGLIGAKKTGGDAATGDIVVFFDCHVAPQANWYKEFLSLISENYRRMVVPQITALDVDTWKQIGGGGLAKCYLTWDADFKWVDSDDNYIPVISGGLLGMSRRWWHETGGYDKEMLGWGGENLDQSLRVWLCGGEIVMATGSQVAHMWRDGSAKTSARYKMVGDTQRNRARAVYAWYGEFADKLLHYPNFANRQPTADGQPWYGSLDNFEEVKQGLQGCRSFAWFLRRFHKLYEDGGLIPAEIFMLQEESSSKCLWFQGHAGTSGAGQEGAALEACNEHDHRMFWHGGNMDTHTHQCCSGLHAWNTDQCLVGGQGGGQKAITGICNIAGRDGREDWKLTDAGMLQRGNRCLGPGDSPGTLVEDACLAFRGREGGGRWKKLAAREPLETTLYHRAQKEHPETFAALK